MTTAPVHPLSRKWLAAVAAGSIVFSGLFGLAAPVAADEVPVEETTAVVEAPTETPVDETGVEQPSADAPVGEPTESPVDDPTGEAPAGEALAAPSTDAPAVANAVVAPAVTVSPSTNIDTTVANSLTVSGTNFTGPGAAVGAYVLLGPASTWTGDGPLPGAGWVAQIHVPASAFVDGAFTGTLAVPAGTLDPAESYVVVTSAAHWLSATDRTLDTFTPITLKPVVAVPAISVSKTDGFDPAATTPITVTGTGFTTTGNIGARPPVAGVPAGVYVVVGKFPTVWKPTDNVGSGDRKIIDQKWAVPGTTPPLLVGNPQYVPMNPDGSFSVSLNVKTSTDAGNYGIYTYPGGSAKNAAEELYVPITFADPAPTPTLSVSKTTGLNPAGDTITITATNYNADAINLHGAPNPAAKAGFYVQVGYIDTAWRPSEGAASSARSNAYSQWFANAANRSAPGKWTENPDGTVNATWEIAITKEALDAVSRADATLAVFTVGGGGVVQAVNEKAVPISFAVPVVATTTTFSAAPSSLTLGASTKLTATVAPAAAGTVTFYAGSSALTTLPVSATSASVSIDYTPTAAGTVSLRATFVPADSAAFTTSTGSADVTVAAPVVAAGSLTWGVKASFRDYVTGPIAKGAISTSGVGTSGGAFVFGQSTGGSFNAITGTGTSNYSGTVTFSGHNGTLNLSISNPVVRVDSASSGTLFATVSGSSVAFATLNLAAGSTSASNGAVSWSGVPATLTAGGATAFEGFYSAGTALDAVSFTIGSASSGGGSSQIVSAYAGARAPADAPPATEGLTVVSTGPIVAGGEITVTGSGFTANEADILAVIYSTPVVLSRAVTADASGVATFTGKLPNELTGTHTLTLQGSVSRGIVLEIGAKKTAEVAGCPVDGATMSWGFKETFRSYISGSIANGEWIVANGTTYETPVFGWENGTGGYDSETGEGLVSFAGSIQFTGHAGALDTTVANPQVKFIDADTAVLLLDVTGVTQGGETVNALGVEFVELDVSGAEVADGVLTITDAPAVLTDAGAEAFGTYPAGEAFDAVTLSIPLADCDEASAAPVDTEQETDADVTAAAAPSLWWILWVALGLVLAAIVVVLVIGARRRATSAE